MARKDTPVAMADIDRYRPDDRRPIEALYRRVFGPDMAEAEPAALGLAVPAEPQRAGRRAADLGCPRRPAPSSASTPRCRSGSAVNGREIDAAWGMDVMVAPERQRQGLGDVLFRTWDRNVGASLGLGLSESSYRLFQKLRVAGHRPGAVPGEAAEPARAAAADLASARSNRLVSYLTLPWIRLVSRSAAARRRSAARSVTSTIDSRACGSASKGKFAFAVRRDAAYLNWKYIQPAARALFGRRARARQ